MYLLTTLLCLSCSKCTVTKREYPSIMTSAASYCVPFDLPGKSKSAYTTWFGSMVAQSSFFRCAFLFCFPKWHASQVSC
ncbi:hypothetical protein PF011_g30989 [Phytophthora fragariae]|uniref:Secreted protein n=1 Tax=Phytophthora fragariae TaxID=53985 RepID=A0A6A3GRR9_9STRA|nr:hypothetical protein PF011_g30989 [Phytophthora fragariae]